MFIPINENNTHWYSVYIDFCAKRINIYDSLEETFLVNQQKAIPYHKNMSLMLVSLPTHDYTSLYLS